MHHFPETLQLGDVTKIDVSKLPKIDLLIGGSPCQGFSLAGKGLAFEDPRSKLFFEYVRIFRELRKINPKIKFLLENVCMAPKHVDTITKFMEREHVFIDSKIFSPQSRKRLYWTNIPLDPLPTIHNKQTLLDVVEPPYFTGDTIKLNLFVKGWNQNHIVKSVFKKTGTILASANPINVPLSITRSRKATSIELERLSGLPDNYTEPCGSKGNRLHAIGNGWECNTIAYLFKNLK